MDTYRHHHSEDDSVILISRSCQVTDAFHHIKPLFLPSIDELSRRQEPKAIILDRESGSQGRYYKLYVLFCSLFIAVIIVLLIVTLRWLRRTFPHTFLSVFDPSAAEDPCFRMACFDEGANMVAHDVNSLVSTLDIAVTGAGRSGGRFICPYCRMPNLTERDLYFHCPTFHINCSNNAGSNEQCPICDQQVRGPLQVNS